MKLYLIQHGISLPAEEDPLKGLSERGKENTLKIVARLKEIHIRVDYLWHSKKLRSAQTAQILLNSLPPAELIERSDINPNDPVDKIEKEILNLNMGLMIVGHLPFLQKLLSKLITGTETYQLVKFVNSAVIALDYQKSWQISWIITPEIP